MAKKGKYEASYKRRNRSSTFFFLMLLGLLMMFLPSLTSIRKEQNLNNKVEAFQELVSSYVTVPKPTEGSITATQPEEPAPAIPAVYPEFYQAMLQYNQDIYANAQEGLQDSDDFEKTLISPQKYGIDDGIVGVISIPRIEVELPLYLGGNYNNLANGFAQLGYTSMPTGGINTNCVVAGHRGWRGMAYMRDVEQIMFNDPIYVQTLWETLEYRVSGIYLIEPWELDHIYIQPGKDLLTIVTCHPYGVGSHRYIVVCDRYIPEEIETDPLPTEPEPTQAAEPILQWNWENRVNITSSEDTVFRSSSTVIFLVEYVPWICLAVTVLLVIFLLIRRRKQA